MAIIIPSKNTYKINNPKIRDNFIDNVSVNQTVVRANNVYETPIYNQDLYFESFDEEKTNIDKVDVGKGSGPIQLIRYAGLYYNIILYYKNLTFDIPKIIRNSYISKIYNDEDRKISWSVFGNLYEKDITLATIGSGFDDYETADGLSTAIQYGEEKIILEDEMLNFPQIPKDVTFKSTNEEYNFSSTAKIQIDVVDESTFEIQDNVQSDTYRISGKVLCGLIVESATGYEQIQSGDFTTAIYMTGNWKYYYGNQLQLTIYGNTIGISLEDGSVTYANGNKPYSLNGNELLQDSGTVGGKSISQHLANNILKQYENGKETATILCSISDYYDENGYIAISPNTVLVNYPIGISFSSNIIYSTVTLTSPITYPIDLRVTSRVERASGEYDTIYITLPKNTTTATQNFPAINIQSIEIISVEAVVDNMSFRLHDQVIPKVMGADGTDRPMSKYKSGNPKVFEVVGSNIIYDGAVWQELTLQEVVEQ
jgi:hypothetical protein